jgi:hypothetical protein
MSNQNQILIPIPIELIEEIGLKSLETVQMHTDGNRIIIEKIDTSGFVCDENCEDCMFFDRECDGDCESCPCCSSCEESKPQDFSLLDLLDGLTEDQQKAALIYLTTKFEDGDNDE